DLCDRIGDRAWKTRILNTLGWCFAEFGSHRRAHAFNAQAAAIARELGDPEIVANAEINLSGNLLALGDADAARSHLEPISAGPDRRDPFQRWRYSMHVWDALGRLALVGGEPERAIAHADHELSAARRHRARKVEARALELRARALLVLDRREEAAAAVDDAL